MIHDNNILVGTRLILKGQVDGHPFPTIQWTKDDALISSPKCIFESEGPVSMTINDVSIDDTGVYSVNAKNIGGESSMNCTVGVQGMRHYLFELNSMTEK